MQDSTKIHKRDKRSFAGCRYLLNVILDQFVDCKFMIHYYTQFTVHKLVQNYFSYHIFFKLWVPQFLQKTMI